jgi:hypothetical protein
VKYWIPADACFYFLLMRVCLSSIHASRLELAQSSLDLSRAA